MNSILKTIIASITVIVLFSLFTGCTTVTEPTKNNDATAFHPSARGIALQRIIEARRVTKDVSLVLSSEEKNSQLIVTIALDNPAGKPITSTEMWLAFDPKALQGNKIDIADSAFTLTAPYDTDFDADAGLIRLGRSNATPVTDQNIHVARLIFKKLIKGITMIDAYDYRNDLSGHTSANMMLEGTPYNVLIKPESPALIIN